MEWHLLDTEQVVAAQQTNVQNGLSNSEAQARLARYGTNELIEKGGRTAIGILWEQLTATMVLILIAAAVVAALLGDSKNAFAIGAIVILYTVLGFVQEFRAEKAIASLKRMATPNVRVLRDNKVSEVSARELVPGDVVLLEAGNVIAADLRLLDSVNLRIQEAVLTGESEPVEKHSQALESPELPLGDRRNLAFMGTMITQGRGRAVVVATAMQTELGKIASLLQQTGNTATPLQQRLDKLGKQLAIVGVVIAALIGALGAWRGEELRQILLTAVSVAVAIVPEGLPAVVTITLALGAQRMLRRNALIRKLPAVETLGSVTVICSDKTGTLTENKMSVVVLDVADHVIDLTEEMDGDSIELNRTGGAAVQSPLSLLLLGGALCNDAVLVERTDQKFRTLGDPTEGALVGAAARLGYWKDALDTAFPRVAEVPFDSERKRMTTIHQCQSAQLENWVDTLDLPDNVSHLAFVKGSVDGLLTICNDIIVNGRRSYIDAAWRERIEAANERLARKGMRVLGVAYRAFTALPSSITPQLEQGLTFVGLFGMIDPPRAEVRDAIQVTTAAGIRTVMITGDHPLTAAEIARQLGIMHGDGQVMTGATLEKLSDDELRTVVDQVQVFARVSPEHKLRIVQALQANGHVASMTGDGVNDAPALRRADIGVAMGITGTDVSKEASDLVLLDDNFSTIVAAVQEGRTIYDNIRKFVSFSVAGNIGKILVMLIAPFLGKPVPLLPLQLLWLNLLTDGLLGLGIGVEPAERNVMSRRPYAPHEGVFSRGAGRQTIWIGALIGVLVLALGSWYYFGGKSNWQTVMFTALALAQVGQALATRSITQPLWAIGLRTNGLMLLMVLLVVGLQLLVVYLPVLQAFFQTQPLALFDLAMTFAVGVVVYVVIEVSKLLAK